jgi:hypothetical protein
MVLVFAKLQKAIVNYTIPAHLFAKNLAASTLVLMKFLYKICQENSGLIDWLQMDSGTLPF